MYPSGPHHLPTEKNVETAYVYGILLGVFGAHHFYLRRPGFGVLYFFTCGFCGCGYFFDLFRMPCLVENANERARSPEIENRKRLDDAYCLWFPLGLLGFHHFYLERYVWGILYIFTLGALGIGWIIDGFRLYGMVKEFNESRLRELDHHNISAPSGSRSSPAIDYIIQDPRLNQNPIQDRLDQNQSQKNQNYIVKEQRHYGAFGDSDGAYTSAAAAQNKTQEQNNPNVAQCPVQQNSFVCNNLAQCPVQQTVQTCAICREKLTDRNCVKIMKCDHVFHQDCFAERLKDSQAGFCPECSNTSVQFNERRIAQLPMHPTCEKCQQEIKDPHSVQTLECMHVFHRDCIKEWLWFSKTRVCPYCGHGVKRYIKKRIMAYQSTSEPLDPELYSGSDYSDD